MVPLSSGGQQDKEVDHESLLTFQYISPYKGRTGEQMDQCSGSVVEVQGEVCVFTSSTDSVICMAIKV